jgi:hypothetical protein
MLQRWRDPSMVEMSHHLCVLICIDSSQHVARVDGSFPTIRQLVLAKCIGLHIKVMATDDGRLFTINSARLPSLIMALMLLLRLTLLRRKTVPSSSSWLVKFMLPYFASNVFRSHSIWCSDSSQWLMIRQPMLTGFAQCLANQASGRCILVANLSTNTSREWLRVASGSSFFDDDLWCLSGGL